MDALSAVYQYATDEQSWQLLAMSVVFGDSAAIIMAVFIMNQHFLDAIMG